MNYSSSKTKAKRWMLDTLIIHCIEQELRLKHNLKSGFICMGDCLS